MRFEGKLSTWTALRGYGSIAPLDGGQELFVHISAFPPDGEQPVLGEVLSFEVVSGRDGRKQAQRVMRSTRKRVDQAPPMPPGGRLQGAAYHQRRQLQRRLAWATACAALLLALGTVVWLDLSRADAGPVLMQHLAHGPSR
ncbi:cold-shock protein [Paucibacter sp. DJ2R-2]|uniref:cold-shock protein n=1 Tax=Paucibacter sp. DJ2R-2 TaxID=2893558 RepID=UPI0021E3FF68|nr:cold shock domain-containing protein [Paucibacter sp. DJ2R-2]MCV2421965.1 cold shock domain-containing protein [Paucibacter sp. DJ4R-1]MCV2439418.1 cold shock domain-containing protein [Paucibacter sp. DJ2R-2]